MKELNHKFILKKEQIEKWIPGILLFMLLFIFLAYQNYLRNYKDRIYLVTEVVGFGPAKGGIAIKHEYYYKGAKHEGSFSIGNADKNLKKITLGKRFYKSFPNSKNEWVIFFGSKIHLEYEVPNRILIVPREGWTLEELQRIDPDFVQSVNCLF